MFTWATTNNEEILMNFRYTHHATVDSTALTSVFYNEDNRELAVVTHENNLYVYADVPLMVFNTLVNVGSVGSYYAKVIKASYGPSVRSSRLDATYFIGGSVAAADMSSTGTGNSTGPHIHAESVGTPKGLTYADDAVVTSTDNFISLGHSPEPHTTSVDTATSKFDVVFVLNGSEKTFCTEASDVAGALRNFEAATSWLDLDPKVVKVVQYFE